MSLLAGILPRARQRSAAAALLLAAAFAVAGAGRAAAIDGTPPYPRSTYLTGMELDWSTFVRAAEESDNFPTTMAADGSIFTIWGDGGGFGLNAAREAYVSIGVAELQGGSAGTLTGRNLIGGFRPSIGRCFPRLGGLTDRRDFNSFDEVCDTNGLHAKSYSILALDGELYTWNTPGSLYAGYAEARLYKARQRTNDWSRADWALTRQDDPPLLSPNIAQAGRNHGDSEFVYAYATRYSPRGHFGFHNGPNGGEIHLLRASKGSDLMARSSWEFFTGSANAPAWTGQQSASRPVFVDERGVGWATSVAYSRSLDRWILISEHDNSHAGKLGVFESTSPWGPWRTVFYDTLADPRRGVPTTVFYANFLAGSLDDGDDRFTLIFTGSQANDAFNAIDGRFTTSAGPLAPGGRRRR